MSVSSLRIATPLGRPKCRHSSTNFMSRSKIWMRLLERSATKRRPCESNASACGPMNSPGPPPSLPNDDTNLPSVVIADDAIAVLLRRGRPRPVAVGDDDVAVRRDRAGGRPDEGVVPGLRDARLAEREQHLALGAELEHLEAAARRARIVLERAAVARPEVAVAVPAEAVRLHEHACRRSWRRSCRWRRSA